MSANDGKKHETIRIITPWVVSDEVMVGNVGQVFEFVFGEEVGQKGILRHVIANERAGVTEYLFEFHDRPYSWDRERYTFGPSKDPKTPG